LRLDPLQEGQRFPRVVEASRCVGYFVIVSGQLCNSLFQLRDLQPGGLDPRVERQLRFQYSAMSKRA
jgi:hypothetical protein